jgi:hypothetical protein
MTRGRFTPAERARALSLAERLGAAEASRRLGIELGTITAWRVKRRSDPASYVAADASSFESSDSDRLLDSDLQSLQRQASEALARALRSGKAAEAKHLAVAIGVLDDKLSKRDRERVAQLPIEDYRDITERALDLIDQLDERRSAMLLRADDSMIRRAIRRQRDEVRRQYQLIVSLQSELRRRRLSLPATSATRASDADGSRS